MSAEEEYENRPEDARHADPAIDAPVMRDILGANKGIWFGAINPQRDASYVGDRHLLTVAPTRTGKGTCAIIPNLLMLDDLSVICVDPKGQNAAVTKRARTLSGRKPLFLNPFNEHGLGTARFNPLAGLSIDAPNVVADVGGLAEALILTEGKDPYFDNTARDLVKALMLHLIATMRPAATLPEMRRRLTLDEKQFAGLLIDMKKSPHPFVRQPAARFERDTRDIASAISSAITQTSFLDDPAIANVLGGNDFSMKDFKERPTTLFIILPARYLAAYARFFRLIVVSAIDQLTARTGGQRTLVILDEFASLGHLSAVETAFGLAAGYNVQLWPLVQDLNQLKTIYENKWESFISNAGVVQWFTPNDQFTADYLSKRIGKRSIITKSVNASMNYNPGGGGQNASLNQGKSSSYSETVVDLYSPQDLFQLAGNRQLLTLAGLKYPIFCSRERYLDFKGDFADVRARADPDPFHT